MTPAKKIYIYIYIYFDYLQKMFDPQKILFWLQKKSHKKITDSLSPLCRIFFFILVILNAHSKRFSVFRMLDFFFFWLRTLNKPVSSSSNWVIQTLIRSVSQQSVTAQTHSFLAVCPFGIISEAYNSGHRILVVSVGCSD